MIEETPQPAAETDNVQLDKNVKPGTFVTLQFGANPETGQLEVGVVQIPVDLRVIEKLQEMLGPDLADENMKFVIFENKAYLAPIKTSALITPTTSSGLILP